MDAAGVAATLREASGVRVVGGGTKLGWGHPIEAPELSLAELDAIVEHNVGDLTAILQGGCPLATAREAFAAEGQMLALDPPDDGATIGGVIATGDSGPLRHRYGGPRDLVLGVQVALPDGSLARAGSKVIKNVAGYDLAKLMTGAYGTLGVVTEVSVRLHPAPRESLTVVVRRDDPRTLAAAARELTHRPLEAERLDLRWEGDSGAVLVQLCGSSAPERAQGIDGEVVEDDEELWAAQRAGPARAGRAARLDHPAGPRRGAGRRTRPRRDLRGPRRPRARLAAPGGGRRGARRPDCARGWARACCSTPPRRCAARSTPGGR